MPLTDTAIRGARPREKAYKLVDGAGLYLSIRPNGSKLWQWDYRRPVTRKRNTIGPGIYPDVTLAMAREWRSEQRKLLEQLAAVLPPQEFEPTPREPEERNLFDKVKDIFG